MRHPSSRLILAAVFAAALLNAQAPSRPAPPPVPQAAPAQAPPAQTPPAQAAPGLATGVAPPAAQGPPRLTANGPFLIPNASLTEMVQLLAKQMQINILIDPRIKGNVSLYTYGEVRPVDLMPLMETILRVNQAAMVKVGDLYRIVPLATVSNLPLDPMVNADPKTLPDDERMILSLIFLKYATAEEMDKLLAPFMGEGASHTAYAPANLLLVEDNSRNMKRLMDLIHTFDADNFAGQRVRLFGVENSRPADLAKDLETVFKAYALSEKNAAVRFIPVDRINTLIAVAPNPGIFDQVKTWIDKLDVPVKVSAGSSTLASYRMKYQRAEVIAMAIMALYTGNPMALINMANQMNSQMMSSGMGMNGTGYGMGGGMGMGGGGYGMGGGGYGMGGNGQMYNGPGGYSGGGSSGNGYGGGGYPNYQAQTQQTSMTQGTPSGIAATPQGAPGIGQTGSYLGMPGMGSLPPNMPHVIPDPFNNTILVQGTPQDIEQIRNMINQLDVAPRQVLIDAKIYEVDLDNEFSAGVQSYLQKVGSGAATGVTGNSGSGTNNGSGSTNSGISGLVPSTALAAAGGPGGLALTTGAMVLKNSQLLFVLQSSELKNRSHVISSPSIVATDGVMAVMNVGSQVPVLTSQGIAPGAQAGGTSLFTNTVSNQSTGTTLSILAHVNSSGVVTMVIDQQVSAPIAPAAGSQIASPSFSNRSVSTQVTVQDGDTVAISGIITENHTDSSAGIPLLHRIPLIGPLFGARDISTQRTELIIFLTPRVIYDTTQMLDATEEIKSNLKRVSKMMNDK